MGRMISPTILFFKIILASLEHFYFNMYFKVTHVYKKLTEILIGIALNLSVSLGRIDIFTILSLQIYEHSISLQLFRPSLMSFISILDL